VDFDKYQAELEVLSTSASSVLSQSLTQPRLRAKQNASFPSPLKEPEVVKDDNAISIELEESIKEEAKVVVKEEKSSDGKPA